MLTYLTPTLINVFVIYAISNLHDISWGNRPSNSGLSKEEQNRQEDYEIFRSKFLIGWLCFNVSFSYIVIYLSRNNQNNYIMLFAIFVGGILWIRLVISFINRLIVCYDKFKLERYMREQNEKGAASAKAPVQSARQGGSVYQNVREQESLEEDYKEDDVLEERKQKYNNDPTDSADPGGNEVKVIQPKLSQRDPQKANFA